MLLSPLSLRYLVDLYFIVAFINSTVGRTYTQDEINKAWKRMFKKDTVWRPLDNKFGCWPGNKIPYTIDSRFTQEQVQHIMKHIYQIQNKTCVRWVEIGMSPTPVRKHVDFYHYTKKSSMCFTAEYNIGPPSSTPRIATRINLGDDCFVFENVIHEMLHALGFIHEQSRIDRDCYVSVNDKYVKDPQLGIVYDERTFEKWPYDKRSIMHYPRSPEDSWSTSYILKDKDEPYGGLIWKHRLGPAYGFWGIKKQRTGTLTYLDTFKINYRFCGAPDFCETQPKMCQQTEEEEQWAGCKQLYLDILNGKAKPNKS